MKYANNKLAQAFEKITLDNSQSMQGSNMFAEHETIYSYGHHFPIATKTIERLNGKPVLLFNKDGYSNTTARHKSHVAQAFSDWEIVQIPTEDLQAYTSMVNHAESTVNAEVRTGILKSLVAQHEEYINKALRARKEENKDFYSMLSGKLRQQIDFVKIALLPLHPKHTI